MSVAVLRSEYGGGQAMETAGCDVARQRWVMEIIAAACPPKV